MIHFSILLIFYCKKIAFISSNYFGGGGAGSSSPGFGSDPGEKKIGSGSYRQEKPDPTVGKQPRSDLIKFSQSVLQEIYDFRGILNLIVPTGSGSDPLLEYRSLTGFLKRLSGSDQTIQIQIRSPGYEKGLLLLAGGNWLHL